MLFVWCFDVVCSVFACLFGVCMMFVQCFDVVCSVVMMLFVSLF